jgi:hypothetical protein
VSNDWIEHKELLFSYQYFLFVVLKRKIIQLLVVAGRSAPGNNRRVLPSAGCSALRASQLAAAADCARRQASLPHPRARSLSAAIICSEYQSLKNMNIV